MNLRSSSLLLFLLCATMLCVALYMEHVMKLQPCYLCITQRAFVMAVALLALLAAVHNPLQLAAKIYPVLIAGTAAAGGYFSGKQLWLQSLPEDQVPACGPPADYLFDTLDFNDALSLLLQGDGNCAEVQWTFLSISIPGWNLVAFVAIVLVALCQLFDMWPWFLRRGNR